MENRIRSALSTILTEEGIARTKIDEIIGFTLGIFNKEITDNNEKNKNLLLNVIRNSSDLNDKVEDVEYNTYVDELFFVDYNTQKKFDTFKNYGRIEGEEYNEDNSNNLINFIFENLKYNDVNEKNTFPLINKIKNLPQKYDFGYKKNKTDIINNANMVAYFTKKTGCEIPDIPTLLDKNEVVFITHMIIDELLEFLSTVFTSQEAKLEIMNITLGAKILEKMSTIYETELIAEQADAAVDIWYYLLNAFSKKGVNLSTIFSLVHDANMNKMVNGEFIRRDDGKIMKPEGWEPPNIIGEIERQIEEGNGLLISSDT